MLSSLYLVSLLGINEQSIYNKKQTISIGKRLKQCKVQALSTVSVFTLFTIISSRDNCSSLPMKTNSAVNLLEQWQLCEKYGKAWQLAIWKLVVRGKPPIPLPNWKLVVRGKPPIYVHVSHTFLEMVHVHS